jgi:hypothetical protein
MEKRTKDLTPAEILAFEKEELRLWMDRIMRRLYKLVDRTVYDRLTRDFVLASQGGINFVKRGLIQLVQVIKERWQEPALHVVK